MQWSPTTKKLVAVALSAGVGLSSATLLVRAADKDDAKKALDAAKSDATKSLDAAKADAGKAFDTVKADAEGFIPLFNGKDLSGWEGNPELWSVQDGAITGRTTADKPIKTNTFLILNSQDFSDFELRFKYKIVGGNSGVQYRSKVLDPKIWRVGGYQADFEAAQKYSGINYNEGKVAGNRGILAERGTKVHYKPDGTKEVTKLGMTSEELQKAIKHEDWNEYVVTANGPHMVHKINGNVTSEVVDEDKAAVKSGVLALQVHVGPPMTVQFKDIKIKPLTAGAK
jgi:hypothetical protein